MDKFKETDFVNLGRIIKILNLFGIKDAAVKLKNGNVTPQSCLAATKTNLDLLAYHGDKWSQKEWLPLHLERLRLRDGVVRFLLFHDTPAENKERLLELSKKYSKNFYVRFFENRALFRCVFIDHSTMLFTHYGQDVILKDGTNTKGWESPQLIVDMNAEWSLSIPFRQYFNELWGNSKSVEEVMGAQLKADVVIKREFK